MQTAVPAGTAVFRGKWKRTDSRFAAFGGRRELRSPFSAPKCFFKTSRCSARLIRQAETLELQVRSAHPPMPHRNVFSKHPGVPLGLFGKPKRSSFSRVRGLHQAILWPLLQNARPPGSLRSPSDAAPKCFSKLSGVPLGLFGKPKRSSSSRFAAFGGRGELRSPLHPPLPPPSGYGTDSFKGSP